MFFYMYFVIELLAIFLDSGIIPTASNVYPVSAHARYDLHGALSDPGLPSGSQQCTPVSSLRRTAVS